jgi:hypothetical protein
MTELIEPTFVQQQPDSSHSPRWSIAIYEGESPFCLAPKIGIQNPVLTYQHVTDVPATFVADPFMVSDNGVWYMFFEVLNAETQNGEIGLATSVDSVHWTYRQIVLRESYHLSYPYVFQVDKQYYMVPETFMSGSINLYKATLFPIRWTFVGTLIQEPCVDSSLFYYDDLWWMLACPRPRHHDALHLYYARNLIGSWSAHPSNPLVVRNRQIARPSGRVLVLKDGVIRFTQDCFSRYGSCVRAFRITKLTSTKYEEEEISESPILSGSGFGWNALGMHHIDPHKIAEGRWIACVDGLST